MTKELTTIKEKVTSAITSGKASMRPKWHFILRGVLLSLGLILVAIALLYVASLIVFALKQTGLIMTPGMGGRGFGVFLFSAPWLLVGTALIFVIVLEVLARKFAFAYKQPLLLSVVIIFLIATLGTVAISQTHMHEFLHKQARGGNLPAFGPLYRTLDSGIPGNVIPGIVLNITDTHLTLERPDGIEGNIIIDEETHFMHDVKPEVGDAIVVLIRTEENNTSIAEHIHFVPEDGFLPFRGKDKRGAPAIPQPPMK